MLCELKVENLALIESLHLSFDPDDSAALVVMTGETGAGKSIMLRAIKMLTGDRAQADWVRSGAKQCTVEALFEVSSGHRELLDKLSEGGFGDETTVIIKRIISDKGRSRIYVNSSLTTARVVRELTACLLNVASQHDHQQLLQPHLHLDFIDTLGEHWQERNELGVLYRSYRDRSAELADLRKMEQDKEQKRDFLKYQLGEIEEAALQPGEDEDLAAEKKKLKNADSLIKISQETYRMLSLTVLDELNLIRKNMEQIAELDGDALALTESISGYCFQVEDMAMELRRYRESLESDPYRLEQVTARIDLVQRMKRKYGSSIERVLQCAEEARAELERLDNLEVQLTGLEHEVERLRHELIKKARSLSARRKTTAELVERAMEKELDSLAFDRAAVEVRWQENGGTIDDIGSAGWDRVEFYFSANPGEPSRPLARIASGGELSRLMLALKCLLARRDMVETVVFDEVDAGIGGQAAEAVARKIQELAGHHQVFCITHLPQIAARGTDHYRVYKSVDGGRTLSSITALSEKERETELARMLAGDFPSDQTHAWARELLAKKQLFQTGDPLENNTDLP